MSLMNQIYYTVKPVMPRILQLFIRRQIIALKQSKSKNVWPIDKNSGKKPKGWGGWPNGYMFAFVLMHDVDTQRGHDKCRHLIRIEEELGFRSTFNFVGERYNISKDLLTDLKKRGFDLGVHGIKHDGKLFSSRSVFLRRAKKINHYLKDWETKGFSSPSMHRNLSWMHDLNIRYGTSTFDTDPFEPQPEGVRTIFPFWVQGKNHHCYLELPYTLPQDFTLFILMRETDISIWKEKLDWIAHKGGMVLLNSHPDYMNFNGLSMKPEEYSSHLYKEFIEYVKRKYEGQYWHALPSQIWEYCKNNKNCLSTYKIR